MSRYITNPNRWVIITEQYSGLIGRGVDLLNKTVTDFYRDFLSVYTAEETGADILENCNLILVGRNECPLIAELIARGVIEACSKRQGYSACVTDSIWNAEKQMVVIAGADAYGTAYGCVDFCNQYCGYDIYKCGRWWTSMTDGYFDTPFHEKLPKWSKTTAPDVEERGIWTWGHVIYDYRSFFDNMFRLKLNEVVIWNDFAPINAKEIADYAHSLGIKLIWGFAWGWGVDCSVSAKLDDESLRQLRDDIVAKYEKEYLHSGCDGIYFQSFTELQTAYIGDKLIAETVVDFVNDTASALLAKYPDLHIQFGLHADSVKNHTEFIAKVDPRVYIIWENCGSFPFQGEHADNGSEYDFGDLPSTRAFVEKITVLRGTEDRFGVVMKGLTSLDWNAFIHQQPSLILGDRSARFIRQRTEEKNRIWKFRQVYWIRNVEYVRQTVHSLLKNKDYMNVQALVEDGMFESEIPLPVAIYAETLWDSQKEGMETVLQVMKYPCVTMANI
ncbi:MAG: hypothetical protein IKZ09_01475 [Clostridia bacterium]|nr:hypothetical protein [Clostridia bacterium]